MSRTPPKRLRILVVDDEPALRELLRYELERLECEVLEAENGVQALKVGSEQTVPLDLIISDLVMPELDGMAFLREWRRTLGTQPPAVITTGVSPEREDETASLNIVQIVAKPYYPSNLAEWVVQTLLGQEGAKKVDLSFRRPPAP